MATPVIRQDKSGRGEPWFIDINDAAVTLTLPNGQVFIKWGPAEVLRAVQFPSFSKSIKYVGFNVAERGRFDFALDRGSLKKLRALANRGIAAGGPGAIRSHLVKAILTVILGLFFLFGGLVFFFVTMYEVSTGTSLTNSPHIVGLATSIAGFAILCRGIYMLMQYSQLRKSAGAG